MHKGAVDLCKIGAVGAVPTFSTINEVTMAIDLKKTCDACPSQWEGRTSSGYPFYVRYRFGRLSIHLGTKDAEIDGMEIAGQGAKIFDAKIGDDMDGEIDWDSVEAHAGNILSL